jgi:hypothetical protein
MKGEILDLSNKTINRPRQHRQAIELKHNNEFLPSKIGRNIPESFSRRRQAPRRSQRNKVTKTQFVTVLTVTFIILVILFAAFWENPEAEDLYIVGQDEGYDDGYLSNYPPSGRSVQQDLLNNLYWVDQDFLDINRFSRPGILINEVTGIVIHFIGNPATTAQQNRNFFNNLAITEERHASSNFIVCLDGRIVQCVPVDEVAYASHHRNYDSISIELCHPDETGAFTDETIRAAIRLTAWLCVQFDLTADDVIRHYDIVRRDGSQKSCPLYFVVNEDAWASFKDAVTIAMAEFR